MTLYRRNYWPDIFDFLGGYYIGPRNDPEVRRFHLNLGGRLKWQPTGHNRCVDFELIIE